MCTFNGERHLEAQLESLLAQQDVSIELVASDDASTDRTWSILERHAHRFAHCRLIRNARNQGINRNFRQTFNACIGEWIAPCDQDDIWEPAKLRRLLDAAAAQGATLAYCDSALVDEAGASLGERMSDRFRMQACGSPRSFAFHNCVSGHAALFQRSLLAHATPLPDTPPYDWWLAFVASNIGCLAYVDEALVQYRRHAATATPLGQARKKRGNDVWERHRAVEERLRALAAFQGPDRNFLQKLLRAWQQRDEHWLVPSLGRMLYSHYGELHALDRRAFAKSRMAQGAKALIGLRARSGRPINSV